MIRPIKPDEYAYYQDGVTKALYIFVNGEWTPLDHAVEPLVKHVKDLEHSQKIRLGIIVDQQAQVKKAIGQTKTAEFLAKLVLGQRDKLQKRVEELEKNEREKLQNKKETR